MIDEMVPNTVIPANGTADKPEPATGSSGLGLTPAQESELGRLYADTTTPTSELQELFAKACIVDRKKLSDAQARMNIVDAESCLKEAFATDVRPMLAEAPLSPSTVPRTCSGTDASDAM